MIDVEVTRTFPFAGAPTPLEEVIHALQEARESIPELFRESAQVGMDVETHWDTTYHTFYVYYTRPRTEEELAKEQQEDRDRLVSAISDTENTLLQLKNRLLETVTNATTS